MITLKQWMEVCNYRITEGSNYQWYCYGPNAYALDSWDGDQNGHTLSVVFDTRTQEVYEVTAYDYTNERAYRMINPIYAQAHKDESANRNIDDCAWEDEDGKPVKYVDLDVDADFMEKASAIVAGEDYDTRVQIEVTFSDDELLRYMTLAHQLDLTFNALVERALEEAIAECKANPDAFKQRVRNFTNEDTISK